MNIDIDALVSNLKIMAECYGMRRSNPAQSGYLPATDETAARILLSIAEAIEDSVDRGQDRD